MPLTSDTNRWEYDGDGVTPDFPYENLIFAATDLEVYFDEVLQVSGFAVSGVGVETGGNVTPTPVVADGVKIVIVAAIPFIQPQDFVDNEAVDAQAFEDGLNRMTRLTHRINDTIGRQATLPTAEPEGADMTVPALATRLGKYWGFDAIDGSLVAFGAPADTTAVSVFWAAVLTAADAAASQSLLDVAGQGYAVTESSPQAMTVEVAAGALFNSITRERVANAAQTTGTITAPSVNPRIDIVHIDRLTGVAGVTTGAEDAAPVPPALDDGKVPLYEIALATSTTVITNSLLTDVRELNLLGGLGGEHIQNQKFSYATDSGVADAYVIALTPALTAYEAGQRLSFKAGNTNTGQSTANFDSIGDRIIKKYKGGTQVDLEAGDIVINQTVELAVGGTFFTMINPASLGRGIILDTERDISSTTGTTYSDIPPGVKRIIFTFEGVSLDDIDHFLIQIGDAGGLETAGYVSGSAVGSGSDITSTAGFIIFAGDASDILSGHMILTLSNESLNTWISSHTMINTSPDTLTGAGHKSLSAELTQIAILDTGGDLFDAGLVNIQYEFGS